MSYGRSHFTNGRSFDVHSLERQRDRGPASPRPLTRHDQKHDMFIAEQQSIYDDNDRRRRELTDNLSQRLHVSTCSSPLFATRPYYVVPEAAVAPDNDVSMMSISPVTSPHRTASYGYHDDSLPDVDMASTPARGATVPRIDAEVPIVDLTLVKDELADATRRESLARLRKRSCRANASAGNYSFVAYDADADDDDVKSFYDGLEVSSLVSRPTTPSLTPNCFPANKKRTSPVIGNSDDTTSTVGSVGKTSTTSASKPKRSVLRRILYLSVAAVLVVALLAAIDDTPVAALSDVALVELLERDVIGQRGAVHVIEEALSGRDRGVDAVLLFVGPTGVGKSRTASTMARHRRSATTIATATGYDERRLYDWLTASNDTELFVVEEVHAATADYRSSLARALRRHLAVADGRPAQTVVLVALDEEQVVLRRQYANRRTGVARDDPALLATPPLDFSRLLGVELYAEITHQVPFLGLRVAQVEECVRREFAARGIKITDVNIGKVVSQMHFSPPGDPYFCASGCRKVNILIDILFKL